MTIPPSSYEIFCQNCGAGWSKDDTESMYYFRPRSDPSDYTSPFKIFDSEQEIEHCPKCPIPLIDSAMESGDDRRRDF